MEISGKTRLFGLIGSPVEHSKSPAMYNYCFDKWKLDYKYLAFVVDKNQTAGCHPSLPYLSNEGGKHHDAL